MAELSDPTCPDEQNETILLNRTYTSITLNLTGLNDANNDWNLCVKVKPFEGIDTCRPINGSFMKFDSLDSSKQYDFSVKSYANISNKEQLSNKSCPSTFYTRKYLLFF